MAERPLVPTARELALGRTADVARLDAPRELLTADADVGEDLSLPRKVAMFVRSLDPRLLGVPLLPLFALGFASTVQNWDAQLFGLLAPDIQSTLGIDLGVIVSVGLLVTVVGQLIAPYVGYLADRLNRAWMLRIGAIVGNLGYLGVGLATGLPGLLAARTAQGLGAQVVQPPGLTLLPDYYPVEARIQVLSFLFAVGGGVQVLVPPIGGTLATHVGWRPTVIGFALFALAVTVLLFFVRETPRGYWERKSLGASEEVARREQRPPGWTEGWRTLARLPTVRWQWVAAIFLALQTTVSLLFANLYFSQHFGLDTASRGLVNALAAGVGLFALLFVAPYAGRIANDRPRFLVGFMAANGVWSAFCYLVVFVSGNLYVAVVAVVAQAAAAYMLFPLQFGLMTLVVPARMRSFGNQTVTFAALPGTLLFVLYFRGLSDLRTAVIVLVASGVLGAVSLLPALTNVERDVRNGVVAAMTDEEALRLRESGGTALLLCRGLQVGYGGVQVLFGVDLTVQRGEIVAVLGTNGAGKSTLLRAIAGLHEATGGAIYVDGEDITHRPPHENAAAGVVYVPGGQAGAPTLTVEDNLLAAGWMLRGDATALAAARERVFTLFPVLRERLHSPVGTLSGGEQQMLALAQALILRPQLLMIDELSLGLAPAVVETLLETLRELNRDGTTILLVEQSLNVAVTIAERAVFLDRGEVRFDGATTDLLARPDLVRAVFMGAATTGGSRRPRPARVSADTVLDVAGVSVDYGGIAALTDVSLSLGAREVVGVIGPNGAGKTTLFDVVSGLVTPSSGTVAVSGTNVTGWSLDRRARAGLGRSFQNARLFPAMTVRENVTLALHRQLATRNPLLAAVWAPQLRREERRVSVRVDDALELLGLSGYADTFVGELSTGSRRAVDVACLMVAAPRVLLLDEPSSGLAQAETEALGPVILRLVRETGCAVLLIEHDLPLVTSVCDRLVAMELGRVITSGAPAEVLADERVRRAYLAASREVVVRSGARVNDALAAAGFTTEGKF
jgi:ABC-type branched-subunit amino acid transport system ATPase component/predicted MFS family arabinose efflux permease